jgi:hypothetical protein
MLPPFLFCQKPIVRPPHAAEVVSLTVTVKEQLPVLPALSVAEQVTFVWPTVKYVPDAGEQVGVSTPSQLSSALAVKVTLATVEHAPAVIVIGPGQVTTGFSQSLTVTVKEQVPVLPALSVAEQVTVVCPTAKLEPEAGLQVGVITPSQLSSAVAVNETVAVHTPASLQVVIGSGQVTTGFSQSFTTTLNWQELTTSPFWVAVQVTVVEPTGNAEPEAGRQLTVTSDSLQLGGR